MEKLTRSITTEQPVIIERSDTKTKTLEGLAVVYWNPADKGTEYQIGDDIVERIERGAIKIADDVIHTYDHQADEIMGRTPDTLTITDTPKGIKYAVELDSTTTSKNVVKRIGRNIIRGSSFTADYNPKTDVEFTREGNTTVAWIRNAMLTETSSVVRPAYKGTTAIVRAAEDWSAKQLEYEAKKKILEELKKRSEAHK